MPLVLTIDQLSVERGDRIVLSGVDLTIGAGTAVVVTGPNGIGKTTLLRAIAGYLPVSHGTISLAGGGAEAELAEQLHYVGHHNAVKDSLTVRENLWFWAKFLGDGASIAIDDALRQFRLADLAEIAAGYLSAGQKRRIALARLLVAPRGLWLLDEPTVALDDVSREAFIAAGNGHLESGGLIVAASHLPLPFAQCQELRLGDRAEAAA